MAFQQGLSGLNTSARALDVISNNISNAATVGFKGAQAQFANVYAAALGVGGGSQIGIGSSMAAVQQQFSQGNISNSNNALDIAINGSGFFRLQKSPTDMTTTYTRNGQFHLDSKGYMVNAQSNNLTGYQIIDGTVDRSSLKAVQLDTTGSAPQATGASVSDPGVKVQMNFDDRDEKSIQGTGSNAILKWQNNGVDSVGRSVPPVNLNTFNYSTAITVYDQKGNDHALSMYFTRVGNSTGEAIQKDLWEVHYMMDGQDVTEAIRAKTNTSDAGAIPTIQFNSDGTIKTGDFSSTVGFKRTEIIGFDTTQAFNGVKGTTSYNTALNGTTGGVDLSKLAFLPEFSATTPATGTQDHPTIESVTVNGVVFTEDAASVGTGANVFAIDPYGKMIFDSVAIALVSPHVTNESPVEITYTSGADALATDSAFTINTAFFSEAPIAPDDTDTTSYPLGATDPAYLTALAAYDKKISAYNNAVGNRLNAPVRSVYSTFADYKTDLDTYNATKERFKQFQDIFGADSDGNARKIPIDFANSTMFGSGYDANKIIQDGYAYGRLSGVAVSNDGILRGNYSNGQTKDIAQLVLADFISPVGLMNLGNNQWQETAASGQALIGDPGTGSRGLLQSSAVEDANVDLTQELVNLITFQRNYQANAQSIKTQDQVMQTIVNLR